MNLNPLTLTFDADIERAYLEATFDRDVVFVQRLIVILALVVSTTCAIRAALGDLGTGRIVEIGIVFLLALSYVLSKLQITRRHSIAVTCSGMGMLLGALMVAVVTARPERRPFANGLLYIYMMVTMITPLPILPRAVFQVLCCAFFVFYPLSRGLYPVGVSDLPLLHHSVALALALGGSYLLEHANRRRYQLECQVNLEKKRADDLLHDVLPHSVAKRLLASPEGTNIVQRFDDAAVLFADIVGFTALAASRPPEEIVRLLDNLFSRFDVLAARHGVEKIKTIGDAYMAVAGVPEPVTDPCEKAVALAIEMRDAVERFTRLTGEPLAIRIGVHCGPVVAGIIGRQRLVYDLWGDTVNVAARLETAGSAGCIHVSAAVASRLSAAFAVEGRGKVALKGKGELETAYVRAAGEIQRSAVEDASSEAA